MKTSTILIGAAAVVAGYFAYKHFSAPASSTTTPRTFASGAYASASAWVNDAATRLGFGFGSGTKTATAPSSSSSSDTSSTEKVARADAGGTDITSWPEVAA